jgi:hypothetical protein
MPSVGSEPTISAVVRPQTNALDRAATGTGKYKGKQFLCGHNILTEGVSETQLYSNADEMC